MGYRTGGVRKKYFGRKHDIIFCYTTNKNKAYFEPLKERIYYEKPFFNEEKDEQGRYFADVYLRDVWEDVKPLINLSKERLGYPTQKPTKLLDRIIKSSCPKDGVILYPFCGCGTTIYSAHFENLIGCCNKIIVKNIISGLKI